MICQICNKNPATVHVTDIPKGHIEALREGRKAPPVVQQNICEVCSKSLKLPQVQLSSKEYMVDIWKLLQRSAKKAREEGGLACPDCGMTLAEFRSKGRLGCPRDYEVFRAHLEPLLSRIHNATRHVGRLPEARSPAEEDGAEVEAEGQRSARQYLLSLRERLDAAIRREAYEDAAQLRDQIQELETQSARPSEGS